MWGNKFFSKFWGDKFFPPGNTLTDPEPTRAQQITVAEVFLRRNRYKRTRHIEPRGKRGIY